MLKKPTVKKIQKDEKVNNRYILDTSGCRLYNKLNFYKGG